MKVSHAWLQTFFEHTLPGADECADLFTFHTFEVEGVERARDDTIIDVDVLPNRSSDCLSHRGVARELSTILDLPMKRDPLRDPLPNYEQPEHFSVEVQDDTQCPRYIGAVIRGVTVEKSPAWLTKALERVGQRSINNIVDATNYVMLELGQPLHAFDYEKLAVRDDTSRLIRVRSARAGESITLLGGESRVLTDTTLLITDGVGDAPLAVAGVKGGTGAEITGDTKDIVLESANFNPVQVRRTSQALKLSTDASVRFQNEPAIELAGFAMRDVIDLVLRIAGGTCVGVYDTNTRVRERTPVDVPLTRINDLLGTALTQREVESILVRFGWEFSFDGREFTITPPWERTDLTTPQSVIEEVGRIYGLRTITSRAPKAETTRPPVTKTQYYGDLLRSELAQRGYSEVLTYTLRPYGEVELQNPLASDKSFLRRTLREGIQKSLIDNANQAPLLGLDDIRVFELGQRFTKHGEEYALAVGVLGVHTKQSKLEQTLTTDITALEQVLGAPLTGTVEQGVFETSLTHALMSLPIPDAYRDPLSWNTSARFSQWSPYPFTLRDIAVWVPNDVPAEEVVAVILEQAPSLLVRHDQFDTFEKDGRVSYAWHLVFQAHDRTLTDSEVTTIMNTIISRIQERTGWEVR